MASLLAPLASERLPDAELVPFSLAAYLNAERPPRRVVLCPPGTSVAHDVAFLRLAAARLLWPAPPARVAEAIEGIRSQDEPPASSASPTAAARRPGAARGRASLLLEGRVDAARVRAALRDSRTRDWIVESVGSVRLSSRALAHAAKEGVRWSALEPVCVEALSATRSLARARRAWRGLVPPRTPVWIRSGLETPRC
jgi:hypothetical protein